MALMATIPMHVIHSCILPRLPVKSLTRFKSVSKSWQTIISSTEFIRLHHQHTLSSDANRLIVFMKDLSVHVHELDSPVAPSLRFYYPEIAPNSIKILASSEFFLLISLHDNLGLTLLSPSTGRYYEIPYPPQRPHENYNEWYYCYGMYLDEANHDYKVVRIIRKFSSRVYDTEETSIEATVYSLKNNSWRLIERRFDKYFGIEPNDCAVIRHLLHVVFVPPSQEHQRIGCFDILAEKWTNDVPFPHLNHLKSIKLTVLNGLLCVTALETEVTGSGNYSVWVMKEYGVKDSWFKLMSVASDDILYLDFYPIDYRTGSRHEVLCRRISNKEYIWYNFREKKATPTTLNKLIPKGTNGIDGYICKGSLVNFPSIEI